MEKLKIDRTKLITKTEYAKLKGISKQLVNSWIKSGKIKTIAIKGASLIELE